MKPKSGNDKLLDAALNPNAETASQQGGGEDAERREHIATAAYYNAERRGFREGNEVDDWLEAEKQIDGRLTAKGQRGEASSTQPGTGDDMQGNKAPAAAVTGDRPDFPDLASAGIEQIEPDAVSRWAERLKVPAPRLREAIKRVGPVVTDVKRFLEAHPR